MCNADRRRAWWIFAAVWLAVAGCDDEEGGAAPDAGPGDAAGDAVDLGDAGDVPPEADAGNDVIEAGNTLNLSLLFGLPGELDPAKEYYTVSFGILSRCLVRTLFSFEGTAGAAGTVPYPDLAAELATVSEDGLTWTFSLRQGVHYAPPFEDVEIVSADFVRALERLADPEASDGGYWFYYAPIEGFMAFRAGEADSITGVATPDDQTLEIRLTEPTGHLGYLFSLPATTPIPPVGEARLGAAEGHENGYGRFLVATGPYMIEGSEDLDFSQDPLAQAPVAGYQPGASLRLVRNPSWDSADDDLRAAYVDAIEFTIGEDEADVFDELASGEVDLVFDLMAPPSMIEDYVADEELSELLHVNRSDSIAYASINLALPPFDDVHVRRALNLAIDRAAVLETVGGEFAGSVAHYLIPDSLTGDLLAEFNPYPSVGDAGDLAAAMAEMRLSAYDTDDDGLCDDPACNDIRAATTNSEELIQQAEIIEEAASALGIELQLGAFDGFEMFGRCNDPADHVALCLGARWSKDFPDAFSMIVPLAHSSGIGPESCCNYSLVGASAELLEGFGYPVTQVPSVDDRMAEAAQEIGEARFQAWADLDRHVMEEVVPWVPLFFRNVVVITSPRIVGYSFDQFSGAPALDRLQVASP